MNTTPEHPTPDPAMHDALERAAANFATEDHAALAQLRAARHRVHTRQRITAGAFGLLATAAAIAILLTTFRTGPGTHAQPAGDPGGVPAGDAKNGDVLYSRYDQGNWHLYRFDSTTAKSTKVTDGKRDYGSDWSPDGTQIVYGAEGFPGTGKDDYYSIVVANADGSNAQSIGAGEDPSWSPSGDRIAFTRIQYNGESNPSSIWVMNSDGSGAQQITDGGYEDWNPQWSPDGHSIAYTRVVETRGIPFADGSGTSEASREQLRIWSDANGQASDRILDDSFTYYEQPDWSPDGGSLVFSAAPSVWDLKELGPNDDITWPRVMTINADGTGLQTISPPKDVWAYNTNWSPDGEWILYTEQSPHAVIVMRPDGSDAYSLPIDNGSSSIEEVSWGPLAAPALPESAPVAPVPPTAPVDARIIFEGEEGAERLLWSMALDGSDVQALTFGPNDQHGQLSPDGTQLLYAAESDIQIADADGSHPHTVIHEAQGTVFDPTWSPDGQRIAYIVTWGDNQSRVEIANADGSHRRTVLVGPYATPAWGGPDGSVLALTEVVTQGDASVAQIVAIRPDTATPSAQEILRTPFIGSSPRWSPDGSRFTYFGDDYNIWVAQADGSDPIQVTHGMEADQPIWTSDGAHIVFSAWTNHDEDLWIVGSDGSDPHRIVHLPGDQSQTDVGVVSAR